MQSATSKKIYIPKLVERSDWEFVGFSTGGLEISTPEVEVGVTLMGGRLDLKRKGSSTTTSLTAAAGGANIGLSAIPSPVNFTISTADMASTGSVYRTAWAGSSLSVDEMKGRFAMAEAAGDFGAGGSAYIMFLGMSRWIPLMPGNPVAMTASLASAEAVIIATGMTATLLPLNLGASMLIGELF